MFGVGPAGTGKTYLAVAFAAHCLERGLVERIILSRPAVEAGERLGFLPGDMREKVDPYLRPLYDALYDVLPPEKVEKDIESGVIEIAPLAFMRGRTLAQCLRHPRRGAEHHADADEDVPDPARRERQDGGDRRSTQIDLPPGHRSGLEDAIGLLTGVEGIDVVRFAECGCRAARSGGPHRRRL